MNRRSQKRDGHAFIGLLDRKSREFLFDFEKGLPDYPKPILGIVRRSSRVHAHNVVQYTLEETEFGKTGIGIFDLSVLAGCARSALHGAFTVAEDKGRAEYANENIRIRSQKLLDSGSLAGRILVAMEADRIDCEISEFPMRSQTWGCPNTRNVYYAVDPDAQRELRDHIPSYAEVHQEDFTVPVIGLPLFNSSATS